MDEQTTQNTTAAAKDKREKEPTDDLKVTEDLLWIAQTLSEKETPPKEPNRILCYGVALSLVFFFVVGVPLLIGKCLVNVSDLSVSDILAYCGTIIGAASTIFALWGTIWFTRRQIKQERYIQNKRTEWRALESVYDDFLIKLNPLCLLNRIESNMIFVNNKDDIENALHILYQYKFDCINVPYQISLSGGAMWKTKLRKLSGKISDIAMKYMALSENGIDIYRQFRELAARGITNGMIPKELMDAHKKFQMDLIQEASNSYQTVQILKMVTFKQIYADIEKEADQMLYFWRKH